MKRITIAALIALAAAPALADLTPQQQATVCTAVKADPAANAARLIGDSSALLTWLNAPRVPAVLAWRSSVSAQELDEAANYTGFDALAGGKRDAWAIFLMYGPRDMGRNKNRNLITDVWGNATAGSVAESVLLASTAQATNTQVALGGTIKTTGTVTATDYAVDAPATSNDAQWLANPANCN